MTSKLIHTLHLHTQGVISIIGAGGKTSLMFRLAKELTALKNTVLTTTTTKIFMPESDQSSFTLIESNGNELVKKSKSCLKQTPHFSAGSTHDLSSGKLNGFSPDIIDDLCQANLFDWIIVEADGAGQKPLKATDSHEPVLPKTTSHLILVAGLDAVGTPLDDTHVHRAGIFAKNTGCRQGEIIDEKAIATAIRIEADKAHTLAHILYTSVCLNKADTWDKIISGQKIKHFLQTQKNINQVIITSLQNKSPVIHSFELHPVK